MGSYTAIMTDKNREHIRELEGSNDNVKHQSASRIKYRINQELTTDINILKNHHRTLLQELYNAVGPIYYCPICGEPFPCKDEALEHLTGSEEGHAIKSSDSIKDLTPEWW